MLPSKLDYLPQLDGLRALAILMVFLHHTMGVPLLWSGVDLFFVLSGYLITGILIRDSERMSFGTMLGRFYVRRAERILPAYIVFLLIAVWFAREEWNRDWPYYVGFLQNIPYAFHPERFSPFTPLWSLAVEQHFYLVWPALIFFLPRRWLAPCLMLLLLGTPVLRAVCTSFFPTSATIYSLTPFRLDAMAAGALSALLLPYANARRTIVLAKLAMILGITSYALLAFHHPWFNRTANTPSFNALSYSLNILILGGLFVWVTLSRETALTRFLSNPVLRWMGRISYCFYLFHLLVFYEMQRLNSLFLLPRYVVAAAAFAATTAIASLSWILLERRVLALSASHRQAKADRLSASSVAG